MQFTLIPPDYAPLGQPLLYAFSGGEEPDTFDVHVYDYGVGEVVAARRLFDATGGKIDVAPLLRNRLRFQPAVSQTGFCDAADRCILADVRIGDVKSPVRTFLPTTQQLEVPALISDLPVKRCIVRGGCDEVTLVTAERCVASVTAYVGGEASVSSFVAERPGVVLFRLNPDDFPKAERVTVRFDQFAQVSWEILPERRAGCRVAWRSEAGAIEHYDFPVVVEERVEVVRDEVRLEAGEPRMDDEAERRITLGSAYETVGMLRGLAGIIHAPQVWIVDGGRYLPAEVRSDGVTLRRHGALCNLQVSLATPIEKV